MACGATSPVSKVRRKAAVIRAGGFGPVRFARPGPQACAAHKAGHPINRAGMAVLAQFCGHPRAAVATRVAVAVDFVDGDRQLLIAALPRAEAACASSPWRSARSR